MQCSICNGSGFTDVPEDKLKPWMMMTRREPCRRCNGTGAVSGTTYFICLGLMALPIWSVVFGGVWSLATALTAMLVFTHPLSVLKYALAWGAMIGLLTTIVAITSWIWIFLRVGNGPRAYGAHLAGMSFIVLISGALAGWGLLPRIPLPPNVELRDAMIRTPVCAVLAFLAIIVSLKAVVAIGERAARNHR
jgi:hypothetical protein